MLWGFQKGHITMLMVWVMLIL
ncbi:MAG: DUF4044 domain-containing protein [Sedimentibacter sp.]